MIILAAGFSFSTCVGGCGWPIFAREACMDVEFWQFSNNPPSSASVANFMTILIILHSTCTGPFFGGIDIIGVLLIYLVAKKTIHLLYCMLLVLRCWMHLNIYVGLSCFFYILSLCMDVERCNSLNVWFFTMFLFLDVSVPPPWSAVPLMLLVQWL